jgi:tRNA(Ile)-lysidine synthetase-like protein
VEAAGWRWQVAGRAPGPEAPWPPPETVFLDRAQVAFPLEVRHFREGDRFWPKGAAGPKKLQDFLVDRKVPRWLRAHLPLVLSADRIVWVAGLEVAEPGRVTPDTKTLLEITLSPNEARTRRVWEVLQACRRRLLNQPR